MGKWPGGMPIEGGPMPMPGGGIMPRLGGASGPPSGGTKGGPEPSKLLIVADDTGVVTDELVLVVDVATPLDIVCDADSLEFSLSADEVVVVLFVVVPLVEA